MEISRQRDAFAFRTATDEHVPNAPAGHRSPEPPFGLSKDGWWHGSPAGDLRGAFMACMLAPTMQPVKH